MTKNTPLFVDFRIPESIEELVRYIPIELDTFELARVQDKDEILYTETTELFGHDVPALRNYLYFFHEIPKRRTTTNEKRVVWEAATEELSDAYKSFNRRFDLFLKNIFKGYPNSNSYGYIKGRNIYENAKPHCGAKILLRADIKNFFPSITLNRVAEEFEAIGISPNISTILSEFLCIENALPLGLSPSPMLANFVCTKLDVCLTNLAEKYGCGYSRYADDLTFSGDKSVPPKEDIQSILHSEGFDLSESKYRISKLGQCHYVTGLSVTDARTPRAPRSMKRDLRKELYFCKKHGLIDHISFLTNGDIYQYQNELNRLDGTVKYIAHIEKEHWPTLRDEWRNILKATNFRPSFKSVLKKHQKVYTSYIDESEITTKNRTRLALCCAIVEDAELLQDVTTSTLRKHLATPYSDGNKASLQKKGLHYADATQDLRKAYIDQLQFLQFRSYVAFSNLESVDSYENAYLNLLAYLLPNRLKACDGADMAIYIEENSKVSKRKISQLVHSIYRDLKNREDRCPKSVVLKISSKQHTANFSLPDFILGVLGSAFKSRKNNKNQIPREVLLFEGLRDRYRIIADRSNNKLFSRKRPLDLSEYQDIDNN